MNKEEIKQMVYDHGLNIIGLIEAVIEFNGITGVGLTTLGDSLKEYCYGTLKGKAAKQLKKLLRLKSGKWEATDPDSKQYGRQLSPSVFEFKERDQQKKIINVDNYSLGQIESFINSYGYTLLHSDPQSADINIVELYGEKTKWIIAECIYELTA